MNQPSLRKTRAAVGDTIQVVKSHAQALEMLGKAVPAIGKRAEETRELLDSLLERGIFGRLKWVITGH